MYSVWSVGSLYIHTVQCSCITLHYVHILTYIIPRDVHSTHYVYTHIQVLVYFHKLVHFHSHVFIHLRTIHYFFSLSVEVLYFDFFTTPYTTVCMFQRTRTSVSTVLVHHYVLHYNNQYSLFCLITA